MATAIIVQSGMVQRSVIAELQSSPLLLDSKRPAFRKQVKIEPSKQPDKWQKAKKIVPLVYKSEPITIMFYIMLCLDERFCKIFQ